MNSCSRVTCSSSNVHHTTSSYTQHNHTRPQQRMEVLFFAIQSSAFNDDWQIATHFSLAHKKKSKRERRKHTAFSIQLQMQRAKHENSFTNTLAGGPSPPLSLALSISQCSPLTIDPAGCLPCLERLRSDWMGLIYGKSISISPACAPSSSS